MKKFSLLLLITILVNIIPCVSFADSNLPSNTKLADWTISEYTNTNQIANSVNSDNALIDVNKAYGSAMADVNSFEYSTKKYLKPCDGMYGRYDVDNAGSLATSMNDGFTLEMWFRPGDGDWSTYPSVFTITDENDNVKFKIETKPNNTNNPEGIDLIRIGENSEIVTLKGCRYNSSDVIYFDKWYHMVVSVGSNTTGTLGDMKLFINGNEMTMTTNGSSSATPIAFEATDKIFMHGPNAWIMNRTLISNTAIYNGKMTEANAKALYDATKLDYTMTYDAIVKKDGTLVPKASLSNILEGNVTIEATITTEADRAESNVYVLKKGTTDKIALTRSVSGNTVTLTAPENHLLPGDYQFVIENKRQTLDFTVTEDTTSRAAAVSAVNAAISDPGTDNINVKTAIFTSYRKFFQISDDAGSAYASVLNKDGIYTIFAQGAPYASVPAIKEAFNLAITTQQGNDYGDAVTALKIAVANEDITEFKNILLTTYQPIFGLPVGAESVYYTLDPVYKENVFDELIHINITSLSNEQTVQTIKTKFDEICIQQKNDMEYTAFYAGLNSVAEADMETTLTSNIEKTNIKLDVALDEDLYNDYQANKTVINAKLAATDISTNAKLTNEFYSALTLEIINSLTSSDRAEAQRVLLAYGSKIDGMNGGLESNINAICTNLTGDNFADITALNTAINNVIANAGSNDGTIAGAIPKPSVSTIPGGSTFGYVVNSKEPGFTVPDTSDDKIDERPVETKGFTDLKGYEWAEEYINKLAELCVVNGKSANTFAPGDKVTRFEYVAMLSRAYKLDGEAELPFADVTTDHWAYSAVKGAYALGIIGGVDEVTFDGNASITREAMAAIVYRFIGGEPANVESISEYADNAEISDWAVDAVYKMQELGLMNGKDGNAFDPKGLATRAETAALICRLMDSYTE